MCPKWGADILILEILSRAPTISITKPKDWGEQETKVCLFRAAEACGLNNSKLFLTARSLQSCVFTRQFLSKWQQSDLRRQVCSHLHRDVNKAGGRAVTPPALPEQGPWD